MKSMFKEVARKILDVYDRAFKDGVELLRRRERNLAKFGDLAAVDLKMTLENLVATDSRISIDETNRGYWINFEGKPLFRASVSVYSITAIVMVDRDVAIRYDGINNAYVEDYEEWGQPSLTIQRFVLSAFQRNLRAYLLKEINKS